MKWDWTDSESFTTARMMSIGISLSDPPLQVEYEWHTSIIWSYGLLGSDRVRKR
jgi:hypothetical protein